MKKIIITMLLCIASFIYPRKSHTMFIGGVELDGDKTTSALEWLRGVKRSSLTGHRGAKRTSSREKRPAKEEAPVVFPDLPARTIIAIQEPDVLIQVNQSDGLINALCGYYALFNVIMHNYKKFHPGVTLSYGRGSAQRRFDHFVRLCTQPGRDSTAEALNLPRAWLSEDELKEIIQSTRSGILKSKKGVISNRNGITPLNNIIIVSEAGLLTTSAESDERAIAISQLADINGEEELLKTIANYQRGEHIYVIFNPGNSGAILGHWIMIAIKKVITEDEDPAFYVHYFESYPEGTEETNEKIARLLGAGKSQEQARQEIIGNRRLSKAEREDEGLLLRLNGPLRRDTEVPARWGDRAVDLLESFPLMVDEEA